MDKSKLKWMGKLAKTKSFILMTDSEAVVSIKSNRGDGFKDDMLLASYKAELEMFKEKINDAIKQVDAKMGKKSAKKGRKITVK